MKRTKPQRIFNKETGKYEYSPAVITNFHCNVSEYFNNNGKRSTFFKQLRKHLFGNDYKTIIEEHEEWTIVGGVYGEEDAINVIKKIVKAVTGKTPEVKITKHSEYDYFQYLSIWFPDTKVPKLQYLFNEDFKDDFEMEFQIEYDKESIEKFYKFILDGLYLLFKNMQSDWGKAHKNYFSPNSTFTYEYKDWKVDKLK